MMQRSDPYDSGGMQVRDSYSSSPVATPAKSDRDPHLDSPLYKVYQQIHEARMTLDDHLSVLSGRLTPVSVRGGSQLDGSSEKPLSDGVSAMYNLFLEERDGLRHTCRQVVQLMDELEI